MDAVGAYIGIALGSFATLCLLIWAAWTLVRGKVRKRGPGGRGESWGTTGVHLHRHCAGMLCNTVSVDMSSVDPCAGQGEERAELAKQLWLCRGGEGRKKGRQKQRKEEGKEGCAC